MQDSSHESLNSEMLAVGIWFEKLSLVLAVMGEHPKGEWGLFLSF